MSKKKSLTNYYSQGFTLANKSSEIYLISLALSLLGILNSHSPKLPISGVMSLLGYLLVLISWSFSLSIPVFLLQKQHKKFLDFHSIFSITIQNTKRILLPAILLFALLVLLIIVSVVVFIIFINPTKEQFSQFLPNLSSLISPSHPVFLVTPVISSFFIFTPFIFALENKGLFASIKDSFAISFRHLPYLATVILIGMVTYSITSFLPITELWGLCLRIAISLYVALIVKTSTLFYYQKSINSKES